MTRREVEGPAWFTGLSNCALFLSGRVGPHRKNTVLVEFLKNVLLSKNKDKNKQTKPN